MNRRRSGILAFALVVGLGTVAYGAEKTAKEYLKAAAPGSGVSFDSWALSHISTGDGVRLKLTKFEKSYDGNGYQIDTCPGYSAVPDEVSDNESRQFCYYHDDSKSGWDTGFYFYYDILVPDGSGGWMSGGYYVDAAAKVPFCCTNGDRKLDCTIKRSGDTNPAAAPFACETSWTRDGNVSEPHWKITAKPIIEIDASTSANVQRAAQLIGANCKRYDTARCKWTRTQKSTAFIPDQSEWISLTNWADSCPEHTEKGHEFVLNFQRSVQISWTDTVGGKISAEIGVEFAKAAVEANYQHSVTEADTWSEGYTYTIPYGKRGALYLEHGFLEVHGDFAIITDSERYLVKNAVFRIPLQNDVQFEGRGQPVKRGYVHPVTTSCTASKPLNQAAPPPPGALAGPPLVPTRTQ